MRQKEELEMVEFYAGLANGSKVTKFMKTGPNKKIENPVLNMKYIENTGTENAYKIDLSTKNKFQFFTTFNGY